MVQFTEHMLSVTLIVVGAVIAFFIYVIFFSGSAQAGSGICNVYCAGKGAFGGAGGVLPSQCGC